MADKRWVDEALVPEFPVDGALLDLIRPTSGDEFVLPFRHDHAEAMARDWRVRQSRFERGLSSCWAALSDQARPCLEQLEDQFDDCCELAEAVALQDDIRAARYMGALWGEYPTGAEFAEAVHEVLEAARAALDHQDPVVRECASGVYERVTEVGPVGPPDLPTPETVAKLRDWYRPKIEPWLSIVDSLGIPKGGEADAALIADAYSTMLAPYGLHGEVVPGLTSIDIQYRERRMAIPPQRQMSAPLLKRNGAHELVHFWRHENGKDGELLIGSLGFVGYLGPEEGMATACAVAYDADDPVNAVTSYGRPEATFAIGMACRLDDHDWIPEMLETLANHYGLIEALKLAKEGPVDRATVLAEGLRKAQDRLNRTLRGLTGMNPGIACVRDRVYRRGSKLIWDYLAAATLQEMDQLLLAKYDPTDPIHAAYIATLV